jgi:hypothetical protein
MPASDWFEIAMGVLPSLPMQTRAIRDDGGLIGLTILEPREQQLYCSLSMLDARDGLRLTIPVETSERGGYSIGCEIDQVYFMGGLDSAAHLTILEVARRKPYRTKERIETTAMTTLHVISSAHHPLGTRLLGRVIDISAGGVGLTSESPLEVGDRIRVDATVEGITIHTEARIVQASRATFGRWRAGCQFTALPLPTQHALDALSPHAASSASSPRRW